MDYQYTFHLPSKLVWKWLKDEYVLKNSITGCKSFKETSKGIYRTEFDIQFGPIKDSFILDIRLLQEKKPSFFQLDFNGKGNLGELKGKADLFLSDTANNETELSMNADVQLSGSLTIAADRLLDGEINKFIGNFLRKVESEIKRSIYQSRRRGR